MVDVGEVASAVVPYLSAAAGAYGAAVVQRVSDGAADATANRTLGVGRRLARRLFGSSRGDQVRTALVELAERPLDEDLVDVLREQVQAALAVDRALLADVMQLLGTSARSVTVTSSQGVQVGDGNTQTNTFHVMQQ
ncbi:MULTISPECIES: hypothetical protein [Micromonospora]|uniref:Uncharacterized protein n=1 Tax=Micromonospora tulbaghiae TaxID=479978 RepID=A0AAW4JD69_9ACTN|nr:hypothetical protein [Micromonospora tulbaghiae]MBO4140151.1 hypothetical protein [Micromonospora tulbaghiae]